jgi:hypothetical protein
MPISTARIDWLSFTVPIMSSGDDWDWRARAIRHKVDQITDGVLSVYADGLLDGRSPFMWSIAGVGIRAYFSRAGDALLEISGEGCELLHDAGVLRQIVGAWHNRITRIDHATDILTDTTPEDFVAASGRKFRSMSVINTPTGSTVYCGSLKSNRYARVYRYNSPHPRAKLLRAEHVFRHADAGIAARAWLEGGDAVFSGRCGAIYKWRHDDWTLAEYGKIQGWSPDMKGKNTELWLIRQVAPAIRKSAKKGTLTQAGIRRFLAAVWTVPELQDLLSDLTFVDAPSAER